MNPGTTDSSGGGSSTDERAEELMEDEGEHSDSPSSSSSPSTIEVHLRIRPSPNPSTYHEIDDLDRSTLIFTVPVDHRAAATTTAAASSTTNSAATTSKGGYVDNTRTRYAFKFNSILEPSTSQATVFKNIGMPAIRNALEGYNSTVFAYGQTGSGKTYSITGGPERYEDRGIIPRAITMLFEEFVRRRETTGATYNCYISYLELYNESGYDLLAQKASTSSLHEVPKVTMLEDEDGNYHFRNLSIHPATSEEEALNLLFLGDTNRAIGETEMNQSSSRSHCIFTIMIECRPGAGAASEVGTLIKSKLNMVDLSGSERVSKTSSTGQTLTEAKYINSSLFFLEMVIVALSEKASGRGGTTTHVPYRNSMMTSVLRDSLGGNCKTVMIATMSPEAAQVSESISTCQFAQRVALVRNTAEINEELEPAVIIRRLRAEVGRLREEVKYLKGENAEEEGGYGDGDGNDDGFGLDRDQRSDLERRVQEYVEDRNERSSVLDVGTVTLTRMQYAHSILKRMLLAERSGCSGGTPIGTGGNAYTAGDASLRVSELERTLQRRDHEIAILVDMVKKKNGLPPIASFQQVVHLFRTSSDQRDESTTISEQEAISVDGGNYSRSSALCTTDASTIVEDGPQAARSMQQRSKSTSSTVCGVERHVDREIVENPSAAFHFFRQRYPGSASLNETKAKLKSKYQEAKDVGQIVQQSKAVINEHSQSIESLRRSRAMDGLTSGERFDQERIMEPHPDEEEHRSAIRQEKVVYRNSISRLKELKSQIEYSQKLVEKNRLALQRDFDIWYSNVCEKGATGAIGGGARRSSQNRTTTADVPAAAAAASIIPNSRKSCSMTGTSSSAADEAMGAPCSSLSSRSPATGTARFMIKRSTSGHSRDTTDDGLNGGVSFGGGASEPAENFQLPVGVKLTGNKDVDNDIVAFYKAKAELMVAKTGR